MSQKSTFLEHFPFFLVGGGVLTVWFCGQQVSERDDKLLAEHMAKLRAANEEVSGDEGSEEEEDTGMGEIDLDKTVVGITE